MWILIIISHFLMVISFMMLLFSSIKGHFIYSDLGSLTIEIFSIITIMVYVFTQTLVLFLIIAINKKIQSLIQEHSISIENSSYLNYKKKMHIHTSLNLVYIAILAILFGAVHTGLMTLYIHQILFIVGVIHYIYVIKIQYYCFKEISKIIIHVNNIIISKL